MTTPLPNLPAYSPLSNLARVPQPLAAVRPEVANDTGGADDFADLDEVSGVRPLLRLVRPGTPQEPQARHDLESLPDLTRWARLLPPEVQDLTAWARLLPPEIEDLTAWARLLPPEVQDLTAWARLLPPEIEDLTEFAQLLSVWPAVPTVARTTSRDVAEALQDVLGLLEERRLAA